MDHILVVWFAEGRTWPPVYQYSPRANTRECIMQGWPYTIVYKIDTAMVRVVRVLHQRREYFNRHK
ncbi:MAG: type II toxin-antitoxin system RelE/ParE family toxin [Sulfuricella sp.]|nr:type II toxin-antitoxin system RelE/ParE family toxin [Sulfuricella sp.]